MKKESPARTLAKLFTASAYFRASNRKKNMKSLVFFPLFAFMMIATVKAQNVSGIIQDEGSKPISNASVSLKRAKDSSLIKLAVTGNNGQYLFGDIKDGQYFIDVTHVSFATKGRTALFTVNGTDIKLPATIMEKTSASLQSITVVAKKPMVEVKADKMIVNVEGTINSVGQDALELLRKSPGVMVDKDNNLSVSGKNGVQVYIDGKPSPLTGDDLANYLKTIQSSQVEAIEIITNPSAKYEAAGNAGIINIRLKKNKSYGTNGTVNAGWAVGTYPKYNAGITLNNRSKKVNIFGNYNINRAKNDGWFILQRTVYLQPKTTDTLFDGRTTNTRVRTAHGFKVGLDYYIDSKNTVGFVVNGTLSTPEISDVNTPTNIYRIKPGAPDSLSHILLSNNHTEGHRNNINYNANYRYSDTSGHDLSMDADYAYYDNKMNQYQPNLYYDATGTQLIYNTTYRIVTPSRIDIYSFKTDYEQNFQGGRLGFGGKFNYVKNNNDQQQYNVVNNQDIIDYGNSNTFNYKENVNALYVNYNKQYKGLMVQVGLRGENTNINARSMGKQANGGAWTDFDSTIKKNYTDLFPSAAVTLNKNPMKQWNFTYSRRIDRPSYQNLNPFMFRLNNYSYMQGNPNLQPQYTNSVGVTYTYKYTLNTTLNYSHVSNMFSMLVDTLNKTISFVTQKNLASQDVISLNISKALQLKWYSLFANLNNFYTYYKADYGMGKTINQGIFTAQLYAQNSFKLNKTVTAEVSGFFVTPSVYQGAFKAKSLGSMDLGLQKTLFNGNATLKASVTDVLHTLTFKAHSLINSGQYSYASGNFESRQFKLNFTWRFGSNQIKAARQHKTGIDDEQKRTNSQGGIGGGGN